MCKGQGLRRSMGWAIPKLTFSIREVVSDKLYKGGRRIHSQHRSLSWRQLFSYHVHQYYHLVRQLISCHVGARGTVVIESQFPYRSTYMMYHSKPTIRSSEILWSSLLPGVINPRIANKRIPNSCPFESGETRLPIASGPGRTTSGATMRNY
ncbi:hypothetical protein BO85DRAFT_260324 [Aspergillus piperis CBS 112811]|uniref:Uncharacterized protein n=1 Tax=Aspergillus piperis CBS 112811 TaxID=1448313 RepID=A0A8G1VNW9_9EURO|nr:hypothetical protein BO85DRAFT_260324 [Aspergillus piperis CBS 112811]RAH59017.1 hypothetical protein BO85DRAFT_260324 [Aspergillus piperis CBS 112811]